MGFNSGFKGLRKSEQYHTNNHTSTTPYHEKNIH